MEVIDVVVSVGELVTEEEDELETAELVNDIELVLELEALELGEDNIVEVLLEMLLDTLRVNEVDEIGVVDWPAPTLPVEGNIDEELEVGGKTRLDETALETVVERTIELVLLTGGMGLLPTMLLVVVEGGGGISECRDASDAN